MKPTREQVEATRAWIANANLDNLNATFAGHVRVLLAATVQPTDEELEAEAERLANERKHMTPTRIRAFVPAYIAGACREGRK